MINKKMVDDVLECTKKNLSMLQTSKILNIKYDQVRYILRINNKIYINGSLELINHPCKHSDCDNMTTNHFYCSVLCYNNDRLKKSFKKYPQRNEYRSIRKYLIMRDGKLCMYCGITHWENSPIILRVLNEHKERKTLCLVCSNCYAYLKDSEKKYKREKYKRENKDNISI
jgi:5-methylcytosine-specific restriction endonuclease McrA